MKPKKVEELRSHVRHYGAGWVKFNPRIPRTRNFAGIASPSAASATGQRASVIHRSSMTVHAKPHAQLFELLGEFVGRRVNMLGFGDETHFIRGVDIKLT